MTAQIQGMHPGIFESRGASLELLLIDFFECQLQTTCTLIRRIIYQINKQLRIHIFEGLRLLSCKRRWSNEQIVCQSCCSGVPVFCDRWICSGYQCHAERNSNRCDWSIDPWC